jgi:pimeloyl-ACP methyl ester carboxylesterase
MTGAGPGELVLRPGLYTIGGFDSDADYGLLAVPENRSRPDSRLIYLPVIRIRATGRNPLEPIFHLSGGPGQSNLFFGEYLEEKGIFELPYGTVHERHDLVMVGYRGVDGSVSLDLPEVAAVLGTVKEPLAAAGLAELAAAFAAGRERLIAEGIDVGAYNVIEVIDDLEEARKQLGYERIHLFGESHGTRLAYLYGLRYPGKVRRSLVVGMNPPGHFVWEPGVVEAQVQRYAELWAADPEFSGKTQDLVLTMRRVFASLPLRYLWYDIDPGKVRVMSFLLLSRRETAAQVFDAFLAAEGGNYSGLAYLSEAFGRTLPTSTNFGDLAAKAVSADYDSTRDYATEMMPPRAVLGSPLGKLLWSSLERGGWTTPLIPAEYRKLTRSRIPTLIVNGNLDFSTPVESAMELLPYLPRGNLVELKDMGHTEDVIFLQHHAFNHLATRFFDEGEVDASRYSYEPMDFSVETTFQSVVEGELLRYGLIGAAALAAFLVLTMTIVGRTRRRPAAVSTEDGDGYFIDKHGQRKESEAGPEVTEFVDPRDTGEADKDSRSFD